VAASATSTPRPKRQFVELAVVAVAVLAGVALRGYSRSDLWIDETLSVNISRLPLGEMVEALRHDGHPPMYYFLLHWWMEVFGQGDAAVRSMSAVISVLTLPLIWRIADAIAGRRCALAALVLMATSPQAVRYATETRMYSLVVLLASAGWLLLRAARRRPTWPRLAGVALVSGLLLLTHYWSGYLLAATGCLLLWSAVRGPADGRGTAWRCVGAVAVGGLIFLPWLPNFITQANTTGTPWAAPARPAEVVFSLLVGSDSTGEAHILGVLIGILTLLALLGRPMDGYRIELDVRTRPQVRAECALVTLVLSLAVVCGVIGAVAFAERYTAIVLPMLIVVAAVGITRLPNRPVRIGVVALVAMLGLAASAHTSIESRTQVGQVGMALRNEALPGDLVVSCPDQLGPGVNRYAPPTLDFATYPDSPWTDRVNWQHYEYRVNRVEPVQFADLMNARAGNHRIWFVWAEGYALLGTRCEQILTELGNLRSNRIVVTAAGENEPAWLYLFEPQ
jgi:4-amino-4-deoxy-L-arabinose transferase-like glycosyltransferase